jgi:hypothetical protein
MEKGPPIFEFISNNSGKKPSESHRPVSRPKKDNQNIFGPPKKTSTPQAISGITLPEGISEALRVPLNNVARLVKNELAQGSG